MHLLESLLIVNLLRKLPVQTILRIQRLTKRYFAGQVRPRIALALIEGLSLGELGRPVLDGLHHRTQLAEHTTPYSIFEHVYFLHPLFKHVLQPNFCDVFIGALSDQVLLSDLPKRFWVDLHQLAGPLPINGQGAILVECDGIFCNLHKYFYSLLNQ